MYVTVCNAAAAGRQLVSSLVTLLLLLVVFRYGKLGHGSETGHSRPSRVEALSGTVVTQIACGSRHTVALTGVDWRGRRMRV